MRLRLKEWQRMRRFLTQTYLCERAGIGKSPIIGLEEKRSANGKTSPWTSGTP
jgi:hypothetical protein